MPPPPSVRVVSPPGARGVGAHRSNSEPQSSGVVPNHVDHVRPRPVMAEPANSASWSAMGLPDACAAARETSRNAFLSGEWAGIASRIKSKNAVCPFVTYHGPQRKHVLYVLPNGPAAIPASIEPPVSNPLQPLASCAVTSVLGANVVPAYVCSVSWNLAVPSE